MALVYLGLGSNLGDRLQNIEMSRKELVISYPVSLKNESAVEETEPVDYLHQPAFLNQIILVETYVEPLELLKILQRIENKLGRKKIIPKGPRIIDMDILLYDNSIMKTRELEIPHPEIKNRSFILKHLLEIDPEIVDPISGLRYRDYYRGS